MNPKATYPGLRVLDLSTNIAGPFAAMILGDLGADVIKIERPPNGDDTRALPPRWHGQATVYLAVNRNKRSIVLDIKSAEGRDALLKLAATADVVIESFPPGLGADLALTYADFRACNPRLSLCSISAFGAGPKGSKAPGYDALVQAVSGMMSFTGEPDGATVRIAPSVLDVSTGMWAAIGIMVALARRTASGEGDNVQVALLDSAFTLMCHQVLGFLATGEQPEKLGSGAPSAAPYRVFRAADGEFMLATATDAQFVRLCRVLDLGALVNDPRFRTVAARLAARRELDAILAEKFAARDRATWLQVLGDAGLSVGAVNDLRQALNEEIALERRLLIQPPESAGGLPLLRLPIDAAGACIGRAAPALGEHSAEVLAALGYDGVAIARLTRRAE